MTVRGRCMVWSI